MNQTTELKKAWEVFYKAVSDWMDQAEKNLNDREAAITRRLAEVKLIDKKRGELDTDHQQFQFDKDLLEKEKIAQRDRKTQLDVQEQRLKVKSEQLQRLLAE